MLYGVLFKVREGKLETWKEWEKTLMSRKEEANVTLKEENLLLEGSFSFSVEGQAYVILFSYNEEPIAQATDNEINVTHRAKRQECLEKVSKLDSGYFCHVF